MLTTTDLHDLRAWAEAAEGDIPQAVLRLLEDVRELQFRVLGAEHRQDWAKTMTQRAYGYLEEMQHMARRIENLKRENKRLRDQAYSLRGAIETADRAHGMALDREDELRVERHHLREALEACERFVDGRECRYVPALLKQIHAALNEEARP